VVVGASRQLPRRAFCLCRWFAGGVTHPANDVAWLGWSDGTHGLCKPLCITTVFEPIHGTRTNAGYCVVKELFFFHLAFLLHKLGVGSIYNI
jgi:hypothetical protein